MIIQYATTATPVQIEGFPADSKRSCAGALHLRPGSTLELTADELAFIRSRHVDTFRAIRILVEDKPEPEPQQAPAPPPAPVLEEEKVGEAEPEPADEDDSN